MKAEPENEISNAENSVPITGDVIGNTAYSERFVLKILLKLANRNTLKEEITKPTFEEDLCILWDMTSERDVVLYLLNHDTLNLFHFALPVIASSRLIEIIIGTIANMCCEKEVAQAIITNKDLLLYLFHFLWCFDSHILVQLLRLVDCSVYLAEDQDIGTWLDLFETVHYHHAIDFILHNALVKELLISTLENLNTLYSKCKIDSLNEKFSSLFETPHALVTVYAAHRVITDRANPDESLERLHIITLTIIMHINKSINKRCAIHKTVILRDDSSAIPFNLLSDILITYESKIKDYYKINKEFLDVLEVVSAYIQNVDAINNACSPDKYFTPSYKMWKALIPNDGQTNTETLQFRDNIKSALAFIMCIYFSKCSNDDLLKVLGDIGDDYGHIVSQIYNVELQAEIANRALNYRNRLNVNIDS